MDIMADITEITMAITIMTITGHTGECIMAEVIRYQEVTELAQLFQAQGLLVSQESPVMQKQQAQVLQTEGQLITSQQGPVSHALTTP